MSTSNSIAPEWDTWRARNRFYHEQVTELVAGAVVPDRRVLDIGCGLGDVLATVQPDRGLGLNVAERLTRLAREKYPDLTFATFDADAVALPDDFRPDYVVSVNLLDHAYDVFDLFSSLRECFTERTLIVITTSNPLWAPLLRLGSRLGWRVPESPRNFITNRDIASILNALGLDVVEAGLALPLPERVPVLATVLNAVLPDLPVLRYASSTQYLAARPRISRQTCRFPSWFPATTRRTTSPSAPVAFLTWASGRRSSSWTMVPPTAPGPRSWPSWSATSAFGSSPMTPTMGRPMRCAPALTPRTTTC